MAEREIRVDLELDVDGFVRALERVQRVLWQIRQAGRSRHHRLEHPQASAMHTAYDRRRRARRRRR